jgi:hypothetical protein
MIRLRNPVNGGNGVAVCVEKVPAGIRVAVADCKECNTATVLLASARATLEVAS